MNQQQRQRGAIDEPELRQQPPRRFRALRKYQREMQQQCGRQQQRGDLRPINLVVEGVQLAAVVERIKNKRNKAEDVEVDGARRIPPADKNKQTDEQVKQADGAKIIFNRSGFFRGRGHQRRLELLAIAR